MGDFVTITLSGPAKIDGAIRAPGWSDEVSAELAKQLEEAGVLVAALGAAEPVLVEPAADPRDDLIERLLADIGVLKAEVEEVKGKHGAALDLVDTRTTERDDALARVDELAAQLAPLLLAQTSAEPAKVEAPAPSPTKRTKAST